MDTKSGVAPSHKIENTFKYLMNDINEISTENGWLADKIDKLAWSFHVNKKVLYFTATKNNA